MSVTGDLEVELEEVLCEIPRGDNGDVLRVTFTIARTPDRKRVAWHSIREFYTDQYDGVKKPGKRGITIRGRELAAVAEALAKAVSGGHAK